MSAATCPKCGFQQSGDVECARCGIIFAKFLAAQKRKEAGPPPQRFEEPAALPPAEPAANKAVAPGVGRFQKPPPPVKPLGERVVLPIRRSVVRDVCLGLSQLLAAGMGAQESLRMVAGSARPSARDSLMAVLKALDEGDELADACVKAPRMFRAGDVETLRAFEQLGEVAQGFKAVSEQADEAIEMRRQLVKQATYPITVLLAHIVITPVPKLIFGTTAQYAMEVLKQAGLLAFGIVVALWGVPALLRATPLGEKLKRLAWHIPWPGSIYRSHIRALFNRTLARNIGGGLELYVSVRSAAAATSDPVVRERIDVALPLIETTGLSQQLASQGLIAPAEAVLVVSGEQSGNLADSLDAVAKRYVAARKAGLKVFMALLGGLFTLLVILVVVFGLLRAYEDVTGIADKFMDEIDLEGPFKQIPMDGMEGVDLEQFKDEKGQIDMKKLQGIDLDNLPGGFDIPEFRDMERR